jgi:prephenate dehydratase
MLRIGSQAACARKGLPNSSSMTSRAPLPAAEETDMSTPQNPSLPVAVPGARGAHTLRASQRFFSSTRASLSCATALEAVKAVCSGRAGHAVIPVENSITGIFDGVADAFFSGEVSVVGEVIMPVRHALMAVPGVRLEDISVVTAHMASLSQCRDWLAGWGFATRPSMDTAAAAKELGASGDEGLGVLGSRDLAAANGLEVLAEGLSDRPDNQTRFLVIASSSEGTDPGSRIAIQIGPISEPRAMKTLRIQLESLGASHVRVPLLGTEDGRRYLVEFDHEGGDGLQAAAKACESLPHRLLGSWAPSGRLAS